MKLIHSLPAVAKAIAAVIAPFVVAGLTWLANNIVSFDVPNPGVVETGLVSIVTGLAVYFTRNQPQNGA